MKIIPEKNYRRPIYAIGMAAVMMTAALTACTDKIVELAGEETCIETSATNEPVVLDGDVAVVTETEPYVELDGGVAIDESEPTI